MNYYELTITCMLKRDIAFQEVQEKIGAYINRCMLLDERLKEKHAKKEQKQYCYSGFYPVEFKTKMYKAGNVYVFRIRSLEKAFTESIKACLRKISDSVFQLIAIEQKTSGKRVVQELYTLTPFIVTVDNQPWLQQTGDLDVLIERLEANAEKKVHRYRWRKIRSNQFYPTARVYE